MSDSLGDRMKHGTSVARIGEIVNVAVLGTDFEVTMKYATIEELIDEADKLRSQLEDLEDKIKTLRGESL